MKNHFVHKDLEEMKNIITGLIHEEYCELKIINVELKDTVQAPPSFSFWRPQSKPTLYKLEKMKNFTLFPGRGERQLTTFLIRFEQCRTSEALFKLMYDYRQEIKKTSLHLTEVLAEGILQSVDSVPATHSGTTDANSNAIAQIIEATQADLQKMRNESEFMGAAITLGGP